MLPLELSRRRDFHESRAGAHRWKLHHHEVMLGRPSLHRWPTRLGGNLRLARISLHAREMIGLIAAGARCAARVGIRGEFGRGVLSERFVFGGSAGRVVAAPGQQKNRKREQYAAPGPHLRTARAEPTRRLRLIETPSARRLA